MNPGLEIKVCGITTPEAARAATAAGADWLGLVLAPSVRRVTPERARELAETVPARWVGVFVDLDPASAARLAREIGLAAVQLHGEETPDACGAVRREAGVEVWKALRWRGERVELEPWAGVADRVLLDAGAGSGRTLPWSDLAGACPGPRERARPIILAGGLDAGNVAEAIRAVRPDGVDASSRLEVSPGVKDPERIRAFVAAARAATLEPAPAASRP